MRSNGLLAEVCSNITPKNSGTNQYISGIFLFCILFGRTSLKDEYKPIKNLEVRQNITEEQSQVLRDAILSTSIGNV